MQSMTHRISVVCSALALAVLSCSLQPPSSSAEEGFVLSTASSPAISIGFEKGRLGIYAGAGFRWRKNTYSYSGDVVITERDTSESVAVVIPALTLRCLGRSETLPWYLAVGVERDVPVYTSATGYDEGNFPFGNSEVEDRLDSENRQTFIDGGLGVRAPLTDRLFLGGEFGVYYAFSKSDLESDMYRSSSETKYMGTYLRVLAFFYP